MYFAIHEKCLIIDFRKKAWTCTPMKINDFTAINRCNSKVFKDQELR